MEPNTKRSWFIGLWYYLKIGKSWIYLFLTYPAPFWSFWGIWVYYGSVFEVGFKWEFIHFVRYNLYDSFLSNNFGSGISGRCSWISIHLWFIWPDDWILYFSKHWISQNQPKPWERTYFLNLSTFEFDEVLIDHYDDLNYLQKFSPCSRYSISDVPWYQFRAITLAFLVAIMSMSDEVSL